MTYWSKIKSRHAIYHRNVGLRTLARYHRNCYDWLSWIRGGLLWFSSSEVKQKAQTNFWRRQQMACFKLARLFFKSSQFKSSQWSRSSQVRVKSQKLSCHSTVKPVKSSHNFWFDLKDSTWWVIFSHLCYKSIGLHGIHLTIWAHKLS